MRRLLGTAAMVWLALAPGAGRAEPQDIPWFQARPDVMRETIRRCQNDFRLARSPVCQNARAAQARGMGKPLQPNTQHEPWYRPQAPAIAPVGRGRVRGA